MSRDSSKTSAWSDADLAHAVMTSRSWRGVLRELGLCATSSGSLRVVKRRVAVLGLNTSHFTGQRTWSDAALKRAATQAHSWSELLNAIGMKSNSGDERIRVKAHALRLSLDLSHLEDQPREAPSRLQAKPALRNLREAATSRRVLVLPVRLQSGHPSGAGRIRPAGIDAGRNQAGSGQDDYVSWQERMDDSGWPTALFHRQ